MVHVSTLAPLGCGALYNSSSVENRQTLYGSRNRTLQRDVPPMVVVKTMSIPLQVAAAFICPCQVNVGNKEAGEWHVKTTQVPEIDPASAASGLTLLLGGLAALRGRRAKRKNAPGRNRTCDLALRRHSLYPLSYRGQEPTAGF
jgi:hypothetical protein